MILSPTGTQNRRTCKKKRSCPQELHRILCLIPHIVTTLTTMVLMFHSDKLISCVPGCRNQGRTVSDGSQMSLRRRQQQNMQRLVHHVLRPRQDGIYSIRWWWSCSGCVMTQWNQNTEKCIEYGLQCVDRWNEMVGDWLYSAKIGCWC